MNMTCYEPNMHRGRAVRAVLFLLLFSLLISLTGCLRIEIPEDSESAGTGRGDGKSEGKDDPSPRRPEGKLVALTFDDGPHNVQTAKIVNELNKYGYHATFFVVGNRVDGTAYNGREGLLAAYNSGNEIAIHGYTHTEYYDRCDESVYHRELNDTLKAIREVIPGYKVNLMRPIGGNITESRANRCSYSVILWSVDSQDWTTEQRYYKGISDEEAEARIQKTVDKVMDTVTEGDIILMHDIYESTADAVAVLLKRLNDEGYTVVSVSELMAGELRPGTIYRYASYAFG